MLRLKLSSKAAIPLLGFGTWRLQGRVCVEAVKSALAIGYRHIDTADHYRNHRAVARAIAASGLAREEIFITSKVWWERLDRRHIFNDLRRFLAELETDYLDLLLAHFPNPKIEIGETLAAFNELYQEGLVHSVGVSNFMRKHLRLALATGLPIHNNQIELHPLWYDESLVEFCQQKKISLTAYSALAQGKAVRLDYIQELARKYMVSPAQVVLNWVMSKGIVALTKSTRPQEIEDSFQATSWQLEEGDLALIDRHAGRIERLNQPSFADFAD